MEPNVSPTRSEPRQLAAANDQLLHQGEPLPGCLEDGDGPGGKPRLDRGSYAGDDRDLSWYPSPHRFGY
jgi:hypothetical protein